VLTIVLLLIAGVGTWGTFATLGPLAWFSLVALLPAAWIGWDSKRIGVQEYQTSLSYPPLTLFLITLLSWVVVLPWYLTVRDQIRAGHAFRRGANRPESMMR